MIRVAAVDLGSNSTRLLVADVSGDAVIEIERLMRITHLGEGVDHSRRLGATAIDRVADCVEDYAERARRLGAERLLAVATSAVRDARNGGEFLTALERDLGIETRMLSGDQEAAMTFRGVTSARPVQPATLVCDIGGGSTELILGGPEGVTAASSLDIGCVRMSERHLASDPPAETELAGLREAVARSLPRSLVDAAEQVVGVAGTVTTLATIDLDLAEEVPELIDQHPLGAAAVEAQLARLAALPLARRREVRGLMPARAPTIVAGAAILAELLRATGATELRVSERDILHGAALTAAEPDAAATR